MRVEVESSVLAAVDYSDCLTLDIEFRSGAIYRYCGVPRAVYEVLIAAEGKGAYFNVNIRDRYPWQRLA